MPAITHQIPDIRNKITKEILAKYDSYDEQERRKLVATLVDGILNNIPFPQMKSWYKGITKKDYEYGDVTQR